MSVDGPDYVVELGGQAPVVGPRSVGAGSAASVYGNRAGVGRPWLAVSWRCCGTYSRVYRNRAGDAYEGRCPRCGSPVKAVIGAGGTSARFFEAG